MLNLAAALLLATTLGNGGPNPNLDASPPPATPPAQLTQPGPPVDAQFQHGVVDPRGTDAQPLAVKVVSMPPMGLPKADDGPHGPPPDDGMGMLVWIAIVFGLVQSVLMGALVYFVMLASHNSRRMAEAVERSLARPGDAPLL
jgi:hypothetical protein